MKEQHRSKLILGALGVVYGDIGTSPLYALKECFHAIEPSPENVLGVLSLVVWTLITIVSVKYLAFVLRADNDGEGGILALMALIRPNKDPAPRSRAWVLVLLGLFGAALLYGDGVLTPAISVLSAVEGLSLITDAFTHTRVVVLTVGILIALFSVQRFGTEKMGRWFGPITLVWFVVLALLGIKGILMHPTVLFALSPHYAAAFIAAAPGTAFLVLGSVFLVTTGGEALYADMGHFGRQPIRIAWFAVVLPALLLNYFGQGALLLVDKEAAHNPLFSLVPSWGLYPMVFLATAATVIASQALISGVFSITRQAILMGYCPRIRINHTSPNEIGQIYIGFVNQALLVATVATVLYFGSSTALASAYGIAVATTMVITTILAFVVSRERWKWPLPLAILVWGSFMSVELFFWAANMMKVAAGGWFPLTIGAILFTGMTTWYSGRKILASRMRDRSIPMDTFFRHLDTDKPYRAPRTAVFMTSDDERIPPTLVRNRVHNGIVHERVILLTVETQNRPYVPKEERLEIHALPSNFWRIKLRFGFMDDTDVPAELAQSGLPLEAEDTTWFLGRETVLSTDGDGMAQWREQLFGMMLNNAQSAVAFYRIPTGQVVEIGTRLEI